jgi:4-hydroxy-L-threonine phosphate dehydrogenase PdxA
MSKAMKLVGNMTALNTINDINQLSDMPDGPCILDLHNLAEKDLVVGQIKAACGKASVEYIISAAQLALHKSIAAMVTAPINKEATRLAGYGELGHLELLAHYTDTKEYATMLVSEKLRVVHLTTHYSLKEAVSKVKKDYILARLKLTQKSFNAWGYAHPVIGLRP